MTGDDYWPFTGQGLPEGGLATEVVRAAFAEVGVGVAIGYLPWRRGYGVTILGLADGSFPYLFTPQRAAEALFSDPVFPVRPKVVSSQRSPVHFGGAIEGLIGLRYCVAHGYGTPDAVQTLIDVGLLTVSQPTSPYACPQMVHAGRADFFIGNDFVVRGAIAGAGHGIRFDDFHVAPDPVVSGHLHFVVGRSHPDGESIIAQFNAGLAVLRRTGRFDRLVAKHIGNGGS